MEALGRRDSNLIIAEIIIERLYNELENKNNFLSKKVFFTLKTRINERRDMKIYSLLKFLKYPDDPPCGR